MSAPLPPSGAGRAPGHFLGTGNDNAAFSNDPSSTLAGGHHLPLRVGALTLMLRPSQDGMKLAREPLRAGAGHTSPASQCHRLGGKCQHPQTQGENAGPEVTGPVPDEAASAGAGPEPGLLTARTAAPFPKCGRQDARPRGSREERGCARANARKAAGRGRTRPAPPGHLTARAASTPGRP